MYEFLALLTAHILADFYFQPTHWVTSKRTQRWKSGAFYGHIAVVTICSYLLLGYWKQPWLALLVGVVHGIIDLIKLYYDKSRSTQWFVYDQLLHLLSLILIAWLVTGASVPKLIAAWEEVRKIETAATLAGLLMCLSPVSFLVGMFTKPWRDELEILAPGVDDNLANAGRWIGMSERLLIYFFVLLNQYTAIGFLIAAKSLLRYNDKHPSEIPPNYITKKSEYVLIGTLASYTAAILIALLVRLATQD